MGILQSLARAALFFIAFKALRALYRRSRYRPLTPGSVALITGGGSGIGLEIARIFARAGCHLILVGRNEEALVKAQATCVESGALSAEFIIADLSNPESVGRLKDLMHRREALKYLVLNAGVGAIDPFTAHPKFYTTCERVMEVNYFANVRLLQMFLPFLERTHSEKDPSRVIVISSLAGILPSTFRSGYTASKHAIQGFMNALRGETSVSITLCCPGYVDTAFHQRAQVDQSKSRGSHRRGVPPDVCARQCINGALHGDPEVLTTLAGRLGYTLRPCLTRFIDSQAKKMSTRSLEA